MPENAVGAKDPGGLALVKGSGASMISATPTPPCPAPGPPRAKGAIGGSTALVGVLGDPVRHSLSPAMHNAALAAMEIDWVYLALPVATADLASVLPSLEAIDCRGLNVTLPHKQAVATLAADCSPLAERLGAVNTLVRRAEGGWLGTNTDVEGFLAPLRQATGSLESWQGQQALVLGCGGSALAVVAGLAELGVERIVVAGRRSGPLQDFVDRCRPWLPQLQGSDWGPGLAEQLSQSRLVVNTTPVGMARASDPNAAALSPLSDTELERLTPGSWVYDLIYTPRPTTLLRQAEAQGCRTLDGLEMLVQQGAAALKLWTGQEQVPVTAMRQAALEHLEGP
jgi:shikimate dehydrogenase